MLTLLAQQRAWSCWANDRGAALLDHTVNVQDLLCHLAELPTVLKDNHRSVVRSGDLMGINVVAKRPVDKNRRRWSRLCSWFVAGEAVETVRNVSKLRAAGIETVDPLFALEKRRFGMVIDSWLCYEYRSGKPCGEAGLGEIIDLIRTMHQAGFMHGDPTWNNFLRDENGILFTIDTKAKPCRGAYHVTQDFILLMRSNKLNSLNIRNLVGEQSNQIGYWVAIFYASLKRRRAAIRDRIKKNRPKNI